LGFLFYNFNPARIFMGDSGSYFLGFVLATSSLLAPMQKTSTAVALLAPVVALGIPIFDTLFSVVRRYLEKRPVFSPDRGHIHHRLLEMGVTHRRAVLSLYAVSILLGASAVAIALGRDWEVGLAIFGAATVLVGLVKFVGYFQYAHARIRRRERFYDESVQLLRRTLPEGMLRLHLARNQAQIDRALKWFIDNLQPMQIRLEDAHGREQLSWGGDSSKTVKQAVCSRSTFNAGPSNLRLVFEFPSDVALSAQAEVLLQLLADQMHRSLVATRSALVTAPDSTSQPLGSSEPKASLA
jgi:UDP-GlcNAc:undecaprenyl-phosphate GlcNAc-1-phosphate transferase